MTTDTDVQAYAEEMQRAFETATRPDGGEFTRLKEGPRKEEYTEIVYAVHRALDQGLPADSTYEEIARVVSAIAEADDPDAPYLEADQYTAELLEWLKDDDDRIALVNVALAAMDAPDLFVALQSAQEYELMTIADTVLSEIRERVETAAEEED